LALVALHRQIFLSLPPLCQQLKMHLLGCYLYQAKSHTWQQTLTIHPNSNRGTENNNQNNFDTNGNLLNLNNIGNLEWHYNNTLNKLLPSVTFCLV
jgi:hypothetical protein